MSSEISPENSLQSNFERIGLSPEASGWLLRIWRAIQVFDDVADGDPVSRADLLPVIHDCLIGLHTAPFFLRNAHRLLPVLETAFFKWRAANNAEDMGEHDARSFMWRAGFYDVVLMATVIEQGNDANPYSALSLYGESFDEYLKEMARA